MKGLQKFLKNKNTVTILGVLACLVILYAGYTMRINKKTALVEVYYANQTIQPKTLITAEMVSKTSVPASFILGTYYKNYNDIVGKYSNYNTMIASGSIFYTDLLVSEENLPDSMLYNINEGERLVSFKVNTESTYGNSIMPGNLVDVYVKLVNDNNKVVYGELLEKVEVLAVKDSSGKNVFETTEEIRVPSNIYFALPEAKYLLYSSLNYVEDYYSKYEIEIVLVPNTVKYQDTDPMATEVSSDYFYDFVTSKIATIDDQKDLYDALINEMEQLKKEKKDKQNQKTND
ncbi:MAG: RcpC/CpaB family pilus assembly protein [Mycoplasmatota bacterium]|nr:RcpC/CpaB family pilus assembly protein [Mycoplasmatota bacterium]